MDGSLPHSSANLFQGEGFSLCVVMSLALPGASQYGLATGSLAAPASCGPTAGFPASCPSGAGSEEMVYLPPESSSHLALPWAALCRQQPPAALCPPLCILAQTVPLSGWPTPGFFI